MNTRIFVRKSKNPIDVAVAAFFSWMNEFLLFIFTVFQKIVFVPVRWASVNIYAIFNDLWNFSVDIFLYIPRTIEIWYLKRKIEKQKIQQEIQYFQRRIAWEKKYNASAVAIPTVVKKSKKLKNIVDTAVFKQKNSTADSSFSEITIPTVSPTEVDIYISKTIADIENPFVVFWSNAKKWISQINNISLPSFSLPAFLTQQISFSFLHLQLPVIFTKIKSFFVPTHVEKNVLDTMLDVSLPSISHSKTIKEKLTPDIFSLPHISTIEKLQAISKPTHAVVDFVQSCARGIGNIFLDTGLLIKNTFVGFWNYVLDLVDIVFVWVVSAYDVFMDALFFIANSFISVFSDIYQFAAHHLWGKKYFLPSIVLPKMSLPQFPKMPKVSLSDVVMPKIQKPNISLPHISAPKFSLPNISAPKISLPKFSWPALPLMAFLNKEIRVPKLSLPTFTLPAFLKTAVTLPKFRIPAFVLPAFLKTEIAFPHITLPIQAWKNFFLQKVSLPKISIPAVTKPQVTLPKIPKPQFSLPRVSVPKVHVPKIQMPAWSMPTWLQKEVVLPKISKPVFALPLFLKKEIVFPEVSVPNFSKPVIPKFHFPQWSTPAWLQKKLALPTLKMPRVVIPTFTFPKFSVPRIAVPKFSLPEFTLPQLSIPTVSVPTFTLPAFLKTAVTLPKFRIPAVTLPTFVLPAFLKTEIAFPHITLPIQAWKNFFLQEIPLPNMLFSEIRFPHIRNMLAPWVSGVQKKTFQKTIEISKKSSQGFTAAASIAGEKISHAQVIKKITQTETIGGLKDSQQIKNVVKVGSVIAKDAKNTTQQWVRAGITKLEVTEEEKKKDLLVFIAIAVFAVWVLPYLGISDKYDFYIYIVLFLFLLASGFYYAIIAFKDVTEEEKLHRGEQEKK